MGALNSTQNQKFISHPMFQKIVLDQSLQNRYHCITIQVTKILPNFDMAERWFNSLKQNITGLTINIDKHGFTHFYFGQQNQKEQEKYSSLLLPIKCFWKSEGLCGQAGVLKVIVNLEKVHYEAFMFNLQSQINSRAFEGKYFLETQIWFLLFKVVQLIKQFEKINQKLGNIHPKDILINEDGQIKVCNKYSLIDGLTNFEYNVKNITSRAFLAPQEIETLNSNLYEVYKNETNETQSELFSLGLTILCATTLDSGQHFYNVDESTNSISLSMEMIQDKQKSLGQHYSSFLYSIVESLLSVKPSKRKSANLIYESLKQYQAEILDLHPFLPTQTTLSKLREKRLSAQSNICQSKYQISDQYQKWKQSQQRKLNNFYQQFKY